MDKESLQRMFASSYASFRKDLSRSLTGQGVSGRREYWNFCAWALAAGVILPAAAWQAFSVESVFPGGLIAVSFAIGWAAGTGILTVSFANLSVRRLHDAGLSAWLMLLYLIPGVFPLLAILAGIPRPALHLQTAIRDSGPNSSEEAPQPTPAGRLLRPLPSGISSTLPSSRRREPFSASSRFSPPDRTASCPEQHRMRRSRSMTLSAGMIRKTAGTAADSARCRHRLAAPDRSEP